MGWMAKVLAGAICVSLLFPSVGQAMEIRQFDVIGDNDQIKFIDQLAQSVEDASQGDQLARVKRFFLAKQPGEELSGMGRFELNLALARIADIEMAEKNPKARRLQVEDVMYVTLERNGILLPKNFRPVAVNFRPTPSPRKHPMTKAEAVKGLEQSKAWAYRTVPPPHVFRSATGSGYSDSQTGIAFFMALIAVAVAVDSSGGSSSSGPSAGIPEDNRPWWQKDGFNTFHQAVTAACLGSTTSAHPNC